MGIGAKALTLARPLFPSGTQILENSRAAMIRETWLGTSRKSRNCQPALSISQWL
jgi:hypothetical protein